MSSSTINSSSTTCRNNPGILPVATIFINSTGEFAKYYFKNNPWKLSDGNNSQKIYRFCIICGDERFTKEEWANKLDNFGKPPTVCNKMSCWEALNTISAFVPQKHFIIETVQDQTRALGAYKTELFEDIETVTSLIRFDKVYLNEEQIPREYFETFKKLEGIPVEARISEIDSVYFEYKQKYCIAIAGGMEDTSDAFLKVLVQYRQKSIEILKLHRANL